MACYKQVDGKQILICYPTGARGDFLASILCGTIQREFKQYKILNPGPYKKLHSSIELEDVDPLQFITICIRLRNLDDYLTVAYLRKSKMSSALTYTEILQDLITNQNKIAQTNYKFQCVVDFKWLFDVKKIQELYTQITSQELDSTTINCIQHNISLQQWAGINVSNSIGSNVMPWTNASSW